MSAHCLFSFALALIALPAALSAQHDHQTSPRKAQLLDGMGNLHHSIATSSPEAQRFFDQGLTLCYAFNHEEAILSFQRAAQLDPAAVMPLWGIALALGPNINQDVDADSEKAAYDAAQNALKHAASASPKERALIAAVVIRYSNDPKADLRKLASDYRDAMRAVTRAYPDDLDIATLYAESIMDLHPWKLWHADGTPEEGTEELLAVLEGVLRRDPDHIGANHFYIHAQEASPHPERALVSANRLASLCPGAGHIVHMPGHIYIRIGDYEAAAQANEHAILADEAFVKATGADNMYTAMYYHHNIHFLTVARAEEGRFDETRTAAAKLDAGLRVVVAHMPRQEGYLVTPISELLRVYAWDDVLAVKDFGPNTPTATAFYHYARAIAHVGKGDRDAALRERDLYIAASRQAPADTSWGANAAGPVLAVANEVLAARLDPDVATAIPHWRKAVELQDALGYDEPADWYYPIRESLGAAQLRSGDAAEAEKTFRDCLDRQPRDGRALFGLIESLKAQNKTADLDNLQREFDAAWKTATVKLSLDQI